VSPYIFQSGVSLVHWNQVIRIGGNHVRQIQFCAKVSGDGCGVGQRYSRGW
jgi:hypothetical protein